MSHLAEPSTLTFDGTACRMCGAKLKLLQRMTGQQFCSPAHRAEYFGLRDDVGLQCLLQPQQPAPPSIEQVLQEQETKQEPVPQPVVVPDAPDSSAAPTPEITDLEMAGLLVDPMYMLDSAYSPWPDLSPFSSLQLALPKGMNLASSWDRIADYLTNSEQEPVISGIESVPPPRTVAFALHLQLWRPAAFPSPAQPVKLTPPVQDLLDLWAWTTPAVSRGLCRNVLVEPELPPSPRDRPRPQLSALPMPHLQPRSEPLVMAPVWAASAEPLLQPVPCLFGAAARGRDWMSASHLELSS